MNQLPIDSCLDEVASQLQAHPLVLLEAPPGTGKTTRVPPALTRLYAQEGAGKVLVLEPRRLAARWSCQRVRSEQTDLAEDFVGYVVRFENHTTPNTQLIYLTAGVFTQRLAVQPALEDVSLVILDEFHERSLDNDLALAWIRLLHSQAKGPRLLIMSATLPPELSQQLGAPKVVCPSPLFPLQVHYGQTSTLERLPFEVEKSLSQWAPARDSVLVFLPGMREIRQCANGVERLARQHGASVEILHGSLSREEQDFVLEPERVKVKRWIFSTNVAETSLTVPGVRCVIDSGLARQQEYASGKSVGTLEVGRISQFSAVQRAGRAARQGPGVCVRLYSEADFLQRPLDPRPEILATDLAPLALLLRRLPSQELLWLTPPPPEAMLQTEKLLERIGCLADGQLTDLGRAVSKWPTHPRLGVLLRRSPEPAASLMAAAIERGTDCEEDLLDWCCQPKRSHSFALDRQTQMVEKIMQRLFAASSGSPKSANLVSACLEAFPDRVGVVKRGKDLLLCDGSSLELAEWKGGAHSRQDIWILAVSLAVQVSGKERRGSLNQWIEIQPEQLWERPELEEVSCCEWNDSWGQVAETQEIRYGSLILESKTLKARPSAASQMILGGKARSCSWWPDLVEQFENLKLRAELAGVQLLVETAEQWLENLCCSCFSLEEIRQRAQVGVLVEPSQLGLLETRCPTRYSLNRRQYPIHYEVGRPPWLAAPLVEFFNLKQGPKVGLGQQPLTLHLLAPNQRPVQITSDLEGFWQRHYPKIRQELCRRYPRHPWPEDPLKASLEWRPTRKS